MDTAQHNFAPDIQEVRLGHSLLGLAVCYCFENCLTFIHALSNWTNSSCPFLPHVFVWFRIELLTIALVCHLHLWVGCLRHMLGMWSLFWLTCCLQARRSFTEKERVSYAVSCVQSSTVFLWSFRIISTWTATSHPNITITKFHYYICTSNKFDTQ